MKIQVDLAMLKVLLPKLLPSSILLQIIKIDPVQGISFILDLPGAPEVKGSCMIVPVQNQPQILHLKLTDIGLTEALVPDFFVSLVNWVGSAFNADITTKIANKYSEFITRIDRDEFTIDLLTLSKHCQYELSPKVNCLLFGRDKLFVDFSVV